MMRMSKKISAQEIYDTVWRAFVTERRPQSINASGKCAYRGPNGAKCAVGVLVTDRECRGWDALDEGTIIDICRAGLLPKRLTPHASLLTSLQDVHDDGRFRTQRNRRAMLREVAAEHGLVSR